MTKNRKALDFSLWDAAGNLLGSYSSARGARVAALCVHDKRVALRVTDKKGNVIWRRHAETGP